MQVLTMDQPPKSLVDLNAYINNTQLLTLVKATQHLAGIHNLMAVLEEQSNEQSKRLALAILVHIANIYEELDSIKKSMRKKE